MQMQRSPNPASPPYADTGRRTLQRRSFNFIQLERVLHRQLSFRYCSPPIAGNLPSGQQKLTTFWRGIPPHVVLPVTERQPLMIFAATYLRHRVDGIPPPRGRRYHAKKQTNLVRFVQKVRGCIGGSASAIVFIYSEGVASEAQLSPLPPPPPTLGTLPNSQRKLDRILERNPTLFGQNNFTMGGSAVAIVAPHPPKKST